jgi:hypothetical protein
MMDDKIVEELKLYTMATEHLKGQLIELSAVAINEPRRYYSIVETYMNTMTLLTEGLARLITKALKDTEEP